MEKADQLVDGVALFVLLALEQKSILMLRWSVCRNAPDSTAERKAAE